MSDGILDEALQRLRDTGPERNGRDPPAPHARVRRRGHARACRHRAGRRPAYPARPAAAADHATTLISSAA